METLLALRAAAGAAGRWSPSRWRCWRWRSPRRSGRSAPPGGSAAARGARAAVLVYTTLVRGVPDLVLILLVYFGGQRLANRAAEALGAGPVSVSPFLAGVLAIGFIYGAYLTETFRGAYLAIPPGQADAGLALGLHRPALLRTVIAPQLVRFALPGYVNVWQVLVKSTAVVSVIGLQDLVGLANDAGKTAREPFVFFAAVLLVYLGITWASGTVFAGVERRHARGFAHAA